MTKSKRSITVLRVNHLADLGNEALMFSQNEYLLIKLTLSTKLITLKRLWASKESKVNLGSLLKESTPSP